jgi:hypothetical protein
VTNFSDAEALALILADWKREIHTFFPAQVLSYDVEAQTVSVRPAIVRSLSNEDAQAPIEYEELPDLHSVPIQWPRGGGFAVTMPIQVGDWVAVHCAENALHVWRQRGVAPSKPGINDEHGLNGCIAVPGCYPDKERLVNVSATNMEIRNTAGTVAVRIKPDGSVELNGSSAIALADLVRNAVDAAVAGHAHGSDGQGGLGPGAFIPPLTGCPSVAATFAKGQ